MQVLVGRLFKSDSSLTFLVDEVFVNVLGERGIELVSFPLLQLLVSTLCSLNKWSDIISSLLNVVHHGGADHCAIAHVLDPLVADLFSELDFLFEVVDPGDLLSEALDILESPLALNLFVPLSNGPQFDFIACNKLLEVFFCEAFLLLGPFLSAFFLSLGLLALLE